MMMMPTNSIPILSVSWVPRLRKTSWVEADALSKNVGWNMMTATGTITYHPS